MAAVNVGTAIAAVAGLPVSGLGSKSLLPAHRSSPITNMRSGTGGCAETLALPERATFGRTARWATRTFGATRTPTAVSIHLPSALLLLGL